MCLWMRRVDHRRPTRGGLRGRSREDAFDEISCLVEFDIVVDRLVTVGAVGDAGFDSAAGKGITKPVAVVAFVGDRGLGVRQQRERRLGSRRPDPLSRPQDQGLAVADPRGASSRAHPRWCGRYSAKEPLFAQAGRRAMCLWMRRVDHHRPTRGGLRGRSREDAFDEISCLVEFDIVVDRLVTVGAVGDAGFDSAAGKGITKPVAVVAFVGDRGLGVRQQRERRLGSRRPDPLSRPQDQGLAVADPRGASSRAHPRWCGRYSAKEPLFAQAGRRAMCLWMRRVDHRRPTRGGLRGRSREDAVEDAGLAPAHEPIVERLVRIVAGRRVATHRAGEDDVDDARDNASVINPGHVPHLAREQWLKEGKLSLGYPEIVVGYDGPPICWRP